MIIIIVISMMIIIFILMINLMKKLQSHITFYLIILNLMNYFI